MPESGAMNGEVITVEQVCQAEIQDKETSTWRRCGKKTLGPGYPYCYSHVQEVGKPSERHTRYQKELLGPLRTHHEHHLKDDKPTDLDPELAMARSLLSTWHETLLNNPDGTFTLTVKDMVMLKALIEQIRKLADTQARINPKQFVPRAEVDRFVGDLMSIIRQNIPAEYASMREALVAAIQRYAKNELEAASVEVTPLR